MKKEDYIKYTNKKLFWNKRSKKIMLDQIDKFYKYNHIEVKHNYIVGDDVFF